MADASDSPALFGMEAPPAAYRVLARKYRPATFEDLIGQDAMVRTLSNAFEAGRIPQAWMLTGVRGVGKTTTARILARALNYDAEGVAAPTVRMPVMGRHCEAIVEGRHVDVLEIDAASHTGVDKMRDLTDTARYKPMSARYRVYILDEVHMLSTASFNALLKTLEEPPEHVKFVFATTEIRKVPVTVLSRCQRFDLRRVESAALARHLEAIAGKEAARLSPDAALLLARAAEGSVRDALSLLDQAIAHGGGAVEAETVRLMLGLADRLRVFDLLEIVMRGDAAAALEAFGALHADGADPSAILADLAEAVHAVTRVKAAPKAARDAGQPEGEAARSRELAERLSLRALARAWQLLLKGLGETGSAPRPAAAAEMVLVRLCHAAELPTPDDLLRRLDADLGAAPPVARPAQLAPAPLAPTRSAIGAEPSRAAVRAPAPGPEEAKRAVARVDLDRFEDLVALARSRREIALTVALSRFVHPVRFERGRIELRLAEGANAGLVQDLQKKLAEWTGERWLIALSQEEGAPTLDEQDAARQRALREDVRNHPAVAAYLARFPGAEVVDVRVRAADPGPEPVEPPDPDVSEEDVL